MKALECIFCSAQEIANIELFQNFTEDWIYIFILIVECLKSKYVNILYTCLKHTVSTLIQ